jgi:putative membrane protein
MILRRCAIAILTIGIGFCTAGANADDAKPARPSQEYVTKAAIGDMFEIASSKEALKNSKNAQVKTFATRMIKDHSAGSRTLKNIIQANELPVAVPTKMDDDHQAMLDKLKSAQSADFDKLYTDMQMKAHDEALALHQGYAENGKEPKLKAFAKKTAGIVQTHIQLMKGIMGQS